MLHIKVLWLQKNQHHNRVTTVSTSATLRAATAPCAPPPRCLAGQPVRNVCLGGGIKHPMQLRPFVNHNSDLYGTIWDDVG